MARVLFAAALLTTAPELAAASGGTAAGRKDADKGLTAQILVPGGWATFGTSFADEDVPKEFAPKDEEGAQIEEPPPARRAGRRAETQAQCEPLRAVRTPSRKHPPPHRAIIFVLIYTPQFFKKFRESDF